MKRWDKELIAKLDSNQYKHLDAICQMMAEREIPFVYVQTPMNDGNCESKECKDFQSNHQRKVKEILEKHGHAYIDLHNNNPYPDAMFCDEIHLNFEGPRHFTEQLVSKLADKQSAVQLN